MLYLSAYFERHRSRYYHLLRKRNRVYLSQRTLDAVSGITDDAMADGEGDDT